MLFFVNFVTYADLHRPFPRVLRKAYTFRMDSESFAAKKTLPQDNGRLAYCQSYILRQRFALVFNYANYLCTFVSSFISSFR